MAARSEVLQVIQRLTPLADVLARIDPDVKAFVPRPLDLSHAGGRTLAKDAVAGTRPSAAIAIHDGWAVSGDAALGASAYAPALLPQVPSRVEAGQSMPPDTDTVAPFDTVKTTAAGS